MILPERLRDGSMRACVEIEGVWAGFSLNVIDMIASWAKPRKFSHGPALLVFRAAGGYRAR